ncbi:MAG: MFS transporter [Promethearchaeota archaeon]|nr:MAG: MFS transporter [Candidatus Lokiarchaeota archaeon]
MQNHANIEATEEIPTKRMFFTFQQPIAAIIFGVWGSIQFFAASVLLIPQIIIALIFLVYSIIDGFNDPILGYLTDRSKRFTKKWGKRFPWILIGSIFCPIFLIFCFIPIVEVEVGSGGKILNPEAIIIASIYLCLMMILYETLLTLFEISHTSLYPDLFREEKHRRKISGLGAIIGGITAVNMAIFSPIILASLGGALSARAHLGTTIIFIIILYILLIPYLFSVRETEEMKVFRARLDQSGKSTSSFRDIMPRVLKDKNWRTIIITFLLWSTASACMFWGLSFFIIYNLGLGIEVASLPGLAYCITSIISIPIWIKSAKKYGIKKTYSFSLFLNTLAFLAFFFVTDLTGTIIVIGFSGIGISANLGVIFTLATAEAIDNATVTSGKREEASYLGVLRVFSAFSYFLQTLLFAIVSGITGFNPALGVNQSPTAKLGLNLQMSLIPMVICMGATIFFYMNYQITKEDAAQNKEKLRELGL